MPISILVSWEMIMPPSAGAVGSLAPVELAEGVSATLVTGHGAALKILHDSEFFSADPRAWQQNVSARRPLRPALEWRPAASRSSGADHDRYRRADTDALDRVNQHAVQAAVGQVTVRPSPSRT